MSAMFQSYRPALLNLLCSTFAAVCVGAAATGTAQNASAIDPTSFGAMEWRSLGPAVMGGRLDAVAGLPGDLIDRVGLTFLNHLVLDLYDGAPTRAESEWIDCDNEELAAVTAELKQIEEIGVPELNRQFKAAGLPQLVESSAAAKGS